MWMPACTGAEMVHVGKNTRSRIMSKGISGGRSRHLWSLIARPTASEFISHTESCQHVS